LSAKVYDKIKKEEEGGGAVVFKSEVIESAKTNILKHIAQRENRQENRLLLASFENKSKHYNSSCLSTEKQNKSHPWINKTSEHNKSGC
jgi:hypothetical protein